MDDFYKLTLIKVYETWGTLNLDTASDSLKGTALHDQSSFSFPYLWDSTHKTDPR